MRSCIIIPPSTFLDDYKVFPQLGPSYIKRFVEENSHHMVDIIYDPPFSNLGKYEVIGFSVTTPQFEYADNLLKNVPRSAITVLGGPHCKTYDIESNKFTYIVKEDGCQPFLDILNGKEPQPQNDSNDQLPHRDKSLHDFKYYLDGNPTTVIITSRGCGRRCAFCEHAGTAIRLKSKEAVQEEIQECVDLGFTGIMFFDDLFCLNKKRVKELCDIIKPFNIKFRCFAHANNFSEEMAQCLSDAGCLEIGYGAEHVSQKILDAVNKSTTTAQNYAIIKTAHKYGLRVKTFLMVGLPGETHETAKELEFFVLNSGVDDFDVAIYYPFIGTEITRHPDRYDIIIEHDGTDAAYYKGKLGAATCAVRTSALSKDEIKYWKDRIYSYHKRWRQYPQPR